MGTPIQNTGIEQGITSENTQNFINPGFHSESNHISPCLWRIDNDLYSCCFSSLKYELESQHSLSNYSLGEIERLINLLLTCCDGDILPDIHGVGFIFNGESHCFYKKEIKECIYSLSEQQRDRFIPDLVIVSLENLREVYQDKATEYGTDPNFFTQYDFSAYGVYRVESD
ncbi:hypothetical protein JW796_00855 [Candidatus Dojkabacteria bacterium]|nr:hypothetical protein [Candidatus Dojkabacteria bacterium]